MLSTGIKNFINDLTTGLKATRNKLLCFSEI